LTSRNEKPKGLERRGQMIPRIVAKDEPKGVDKSGDQTVRGRCCQGKGGDERSR